MPVGIAKAKPTGTTYVGLTLGEPAPKDLAHLLPRSRKMAVKCQRRLPPFEAELFPRIDEDSNRVALLRFHHFNTAFDLGQRDHSRD